MRNLLASFAVALAIFAGSATVNQAQAQYHHSSDARIGEFGSPEAGLVLGVVLYETFYEFGFKAVSDCMDRNAGRPGKWLGAGPAPAGHEKVSCSMAYRHDVGAETRAALIASYQATQR